jgi:hypothetical protein
VNNGRTNNMPTNTNPDLTPRTDAFDAELERCRELTHLALNNPKDIVHSLYWQARQAGKLMAKQLELELQAIQRERDQWRGIAKEALHHQPENCLHCQDLLERMETMIDLSGWKTSTNKTKGDDVQ